MSIGTYGSIRPSDVKLEDIDMFYNYIPNRYTQSNEMFRLNPTEVMEYCYLPTDDDISTGGEDLLEGIYNLKLPTSVFNKIGLYTIYIKPKTVVNSIIDCGVLSALPTVKGIVLDINSLPENLRSNNALQGYRIEYIDTTTGDKIRNLIRYVVTSNKVSVTVENVGNTKQKAQRYRFDDSGTLLFLQLTPSSSSDVKPNITPFIGVLGQTITLTNTFFTPVVLEIDLVKNTIDTLSDFIVGEQIKDTQKGIITHYDANRNITNQYNVFDVKEDTTDVPLYEVREKRDTIDISQDFNKIVEDVI
jgi:hypothetical protein